MDHGGILLGPLLIGARSTQPGCDAITVHGRGATHAAKRRGLQPVLEREHPSAHRLASADWSRWGALPAETFGNGSARFKSTKDARGCRPHHPRSRRGRARKRAPSRRSRGDTPAARTTPTNWPRVPRRSGPVDQCFPRSRPIAAAQRVQAAFEEIVRAHASMIHPPASLGRRVRLRNQDNCA